LLARIGVMKALNRHVERVIARIKELIADLERQLRSIYE
jgi:hypothetical protein